MLVFKWTHRDILSMFHISSVLFLRFISSKACLAFSISNTEDKLQVKERKKIDITWGRVRGLTALRRLNLYNACVIKKENINIVLYHRIDSSVFLCWSIFFLKNLHA